MSPRFLRIAMAFVVSAAAAGLSGCQTTMLQDSRILSDTAAVIGVQPATLRLTERRTLGPTNTAYQVQTAAGVTYACVINGGGLLAAGMTNPPICNRVP